MELSRRSWIQASLAGMLAAPPWIQAAAAADAKRSLAGEVGITTGSFMQHLRADPALHKTLLLDLPRRMREEDMRVIDLMNETLASLEPAYLDELRSRAEQHGCVITNLKMNQRNVDLASPDADVRRRTLDEYRRSIDVAQRLGCRWVRPAPRGKRPDMELLAAGLRELIDYAAPKGIGVLIENNAWMSDDPAAITDIITAVARPGIAAAPDTGNWTDAARYAGLAQSFPRAVTCDFKASELGPHGEHPKYDLKRCFQIGWDAGFRGPWCLEHFDKTLDGLWRGFGRLRDMLRGWMKEATENAQ